MGKINFLITFFLLFLNTSLFALGTATRDLPSCYTAGSNFEVTIYVNTDTQNPPTGVIISETLPSNWSITSATPNYSKYQSSTNTYKWLKFNSSGVSPFIITYTVSVPSDATGTYNFSGTIFTTTSGKLPIEGDTSISDIQKGDINKDAEVDISDVILCLRQAIGLGPKEPSVSDINEDGEVDISDVILTLRIAIGLN